MKTTVPCMHCLLMSRARSRAIHQDPESLKECVLQVHTRRQLASCRWQRSTSTALLRRLQMLRPAAWLLSRCVAVEASGHALEALKLKRDLSSSAANESKGFQK